MPPKILRLGDSGPAVAALQALLNHAGATPRLDEDGDFGADTRAAVVAFQLRRGLDDDGRAGPDTLAALEHGADESPMVCAPPAALPAVLAARIARARATCNRGIRYRLGHGGWNPKAELPGRPGPVDPADKGSGSDCSGAAAFWAGRRRSETIAAGLWGISTVSMHRDGKRPGGLFREIPAPVPGCWAAYPDHDGKQGHTGLVTQVSPTLRGIDCSSSRSDATGEAITERGFEFFRQRGAIWLLLETDPDVSTLGNC